MSGNDPVFNHTLQQEIHDLREQAMLFAARQETKSRSCQGRRAGSHDESVLVGYIDEPATAAARSRLIGCRKGPTISLYVGTHAVFQLSMVAPHIEHSKLFISRLGAIASVRR